TGSGVGSGVCGGPGPGPARVRGRCWCRSGRCVLPGLGGPGRWLRLRLRRRHPPRRSSSFPPFVCCGAGSTRGGVEARSVARVWKSCCSGHRKCFSVFLCGAGSKDPSFLWGDGHVVDACFSTAHQPVFVEFPEFISVAAPPLSLDVAAFVLETYCDAVFVEGPQF